MAAKTSPLFELSRVLVRLDHFASLTAKRLSSFGPPCPAFSSALQYSSAMTLDFL